MIEVDFDPYASWLKIRDSERPPSPYQLLGLAPLEGDQNRIRAAYQRQEVALSRITDQADTAVVSALQEELQAALELLSDPERKAVLDAQIRRQNGSPTHATPPVGAAASGTVACPGCRRENPAGRRFCSACGQPLWQKCPKCEAECAAVEKFCGACGTDVAAMLAQQVRDCQLRLDEALELANGHHFEAAIRTLRSVAATSDPRLELFAARALAEIDRVEQARRAAASVADSGLEEAQQFFAASAYERAIEVLINVPEPLRTQEHTALLERARSVRNEVLSLSGEIRLAVEQKMISDLAPKLERLLSLVPNHAQGRQLAEHLREHHVKIAKSRLKQFKYQEALDHILTIPLVVTNETAETLRDTAAELAALVRESREGALADRNHVALAERLCKLAPQDEVAARLRDQVLQKAKAQPSDSRLGTVNLATPLKTSLLGPPIDWLAHFKRATVADESVHRTLGAHPGQFYVAFGLALQGLGMTSVDSDLTPKPTQGGLLGSISSLAAARRTGTTAWGLDLSDYSLKAILVQAIGRRTVQIKAAHWMAVEPVASRTDVAAQAESVQRALASFAESVGNCKGAKVCVDLPSQRVLGRFFELPPIAAKKISEALQYEAKHQIPIPLDELCWSYSVLDQKTGKADEQPRRFILQAARDTHVRDRIGRFKEAGISVDFVQSNAVALHNALCFELLDESEDGSAGAIAAIDVGSEATNVVVCSRRSVWFRSFGQGGEAFARELQRQLLLTSEQSALVFREPARAKRFSRWMEVMQPLYTQLGSEVLRSLATYHKLWPEEPVRQVYGLGGAFPAVGLLRYLRTGR